MPPPPDCIELRGLRALGAHGALPEERDRLQPFEVDLDLHLDLAPACHSDSLADTVDYGTLAQRVEGVVAHGHFSLLEALAQAVADAVLSDERVVAVTVRVRKLRPPVPLDIASVGVTLSRRRAGPHRP